MVSILEQEHDGFPAGLTRKVADELIGKDPDLPRIRNLLSAAGIRGEEADGFIYDTVRKINRDVFYPLDHVELLLAEGCDMACTYCFESAILDQSLKRRRVMREDVIRRAIDLTIDHSREGVELGLTLFGGEPTLNFPGIKTAVSYFEERARRNGSDSIINMTTNGLHLNHEMIGFLGDHNVRVLLSIDGGTETHDRYRKDRKGRGTFDRVISNMRALKKVQPWIGAKMTVMPSEAPRLFDNVRELHGEGVNQFLVGAATGLDWDDDSYGEFLSQWRQIGEWVLRDKPSNLRISDFEETEPDGYDGARYGCRAGRGTIAVNVAGEVSGCSKIISLESGKVVGKLGDVWNGLYNIQARIQMAGCGALKRNCKAAGLGDEFQGGCFATNYEDSGDLYVPSIRDHQMTSSMEAITAEVLLEGSGT